MKITTQKIGHVVVAQLVGEIDMVDSEGLGDALAEIVAAKPQQLVLDMAGVTYVASVGLSLLLRLAQDLRKIQCPLVIAAATPAVQTVLDTVRLGAAIPIDATVEAALGRLTGKVAQPA